MQNGDRLCHSHTLYFSSLSLSVSLHFIYLFCTLHIECAPCQNVCCPIRTGLSAPQAEQQKQKPMLTTKRNRRQHYKHNECIVLTYLDSESFNKMWFVEIKSDNITNEQHWMTNHRHDDDGDDLPDAAVAQSQWVVLFSKWVKIKQQRRLYFSSSHSRKLSYMLDASSIHRTGRGFTTSHRKNQYFVRWMNCGWTGELAIMSKYSNQLMHPVFVGLAWLFHSRYA